MFLIRRRGERFTARRISWVAIYPCEGARERAAERALARALKAGGADRVRQLCRHQLPTEQCWLQGDGWCLAYS